ncbi:acetyl-CoA synthetase-like protein [Desarmillaria ectypa]|nr:acetyl-CoA synthetase-like protein [Desarmillaria ectypa]
MASQDTFSRTSTSVELSCPEDITGLERIVLAAQGDLQRVLSSFFGRPISIERIYAHTSPREQPASPEHPITQKRQVHLVCSSRTVCVATSSVTITSPECEGLFLDQKFAIGQLFRHLRCPPKFTLIDAETNVIGARRELRRNYRLEIEGIVCDILEEFPDRDMFVRGQGWLDEPIPKIPAQPSPLSGTSSSLFQFTPFSPISNPTLISILERQAADPTVGQRVFALYPDPFDQTSPSPNHYAEITYRQFNDLVDAEAALWSERFMPVVKTSKSHPVIAVLGDSGFDLAVTVLALSKLHATVFLLAPANSLAAVKHLLGSCDVSVLLYGQNHMKSAVEAAADCAVAALPLMAVPPFGSSGSSQYRTFLPTPPEIPIIVHSSGSTAYPKPVRWSNTSFLANGQIMVTSGEWSAFARPNNRFLCLGPLFHTMGLTLGLASTICSGSTIVFPLVKQWPPTPGDVIRSLRAGNITTCILVPILLDQLVGTLEDDPNGQDTFDLLAKLRVLIVGGAHCPDSLADRLVSRGVNLKYVYGSSETGHLMVGSHERLTADNRASWKLLQPFPHTSPLLKPVESSDHRKLYQVHMAADDVRLAVGALNPGEKTWNTGDIVQEVSPGNFRILYRDDDILVHDSGEKTNPIPMELRCRENKLISRVAIVGHRRPACAAIIQLNEVEARQYTEEESHEICRGVIKAANLEAPSHSRVMEDMLLVLPLGYKQIPVTPKGNCIRVKVLEMFSEEIEKLYHDLDGDSTTSTSTLVTSHSELRDQVSKIFAELTDQKDQSLDLDKSLFDLGLDSVTALALRNRLAKAFGVKLPQQFVYHNFSVTRLSLALYTLVAPTPERLPSPTAHFVDKNQVLHELLERQLLALGLSSNFILASRSPATSYPGDGQVVAVVGAAGSLGIWQVKMLLERPDVTKVVCMVRGSDVAAVYKKLKIGFSKAGLLELANETDLWLDNQVAHPDVPSIQLNQRVVAVPFDLSNPKFDRNEYLDLARGLTTIIHTAWKMDFNQVVQGFEDCLIGTTQLLLLAGFMRPKEFYFISSIGAVLESEQKPVPEIILPWGKDSHIPASPHGYSESKFVCEYLVENAASLLEISCSVARVGQITGDTVSGAWKTQEMNPSIIAGSARIGKFPIVPDAVDWIPVDVVASTTVELALQPQKSGVVRVHHVVHPFPSSYKDMVHHLQACGISVVPVSPQEWWTAICADEDNPCMKMEAYIQDIFVNAHDRDDSDIRGVPTLDLPQTLAASKSLRQCPALDSSLWQRYISCWRRTGFLA